MAVFAMSLNRTIEPGFGFFYAMSAFISVVVAVCLRAVAERNNKKENTVAATTIEFPSLADFRVNFKVNLLVDYERHFDHLSVLTVACDYPKSCI